MKYVAPSMKQHYDYCNHACYYGAIRKQRTRVVNCEECGTEFSYRFYERKGPRRFCGNKCATKATARDNRSYDEIFKRWEKKYGSEKATQLIEECKKKRSASMMGIGKGATRSPELRRRISETLKGTPNALKGMTFEQFYGPERARELGAKHSSRLKAGFASGRIKPTARSGQASEYRGIRLRSRLEEYAIRHLEETLGRTLGQDLLYESHRFTWHDANGSHTYTPDLYDTITGKFYEVKPQRFVDMRTEEDLLKRASVLAAGYEIEFLTDSTVRVPRAGQASRTEI